MNYIIGYLLIGLTIVVVYTIEDYYLIKENDYNRVDNIKSYFKYFGLSNYVFAFFLILFLWPFFLIYFILK